MNPRTKASLKEIFTEVEEEFKGKSTEFCLEVAAELARVRHIKHDCDAGDIAEAIAE